MACGSGYCGPLKIPVSAAPEQMSLESFLIHDDKHDQDSCCDVGNSMVGNTSKDTCRGIDEPGHLVTTESMFNEPVEDSANSGPSDQATQGHCCDSETAMQDDCCKLPKTLSTDCEDGCCGGSLEKTEGGVSSGTKGVMADDDCCTPKSTDPGCNKSCCFAPERPKVEDINAPGCCKGKTSPCCDVSCLDRLALRECENEMPVAQLDDSRGIQE